MMRDCILHLAQENERLKAALKPFADAADQISDHIPDRWTIWEQPAAMEITIGDLRRASSVCSKNQMGGQ